MQVAHEVRFAGLGGVTEHDDSGAREKRVALVSAALTLRATELADSGTTIPARSSISLSSVAAQSPAAYMTVLDNEMQLEISREVRAEFGGIMWARWDLK